MDGEIALFVVSVLGVIFTGLATVAALITAFRPPPKRQVQYYLDRSLRLLPDVPAGDIASARVKMHAQQQPAVTVIRVANTGRSSLPPIDWNAPLEIRFAGQSVLSARQTAARPSGLEVELAIDGDRVLVEPFLFNSHDLIELTATTERTPDVMVHARIRDIKRVARKRYVYPPGTGVDGELTSGDKVMYFIVFPAVLVFLLVLGLTRGTPEVQVLSAWWLIGISIATYGFLWWAIVRSRLWRPE